MWTPPAEASALVPKFRYDLSVRLSDIAEKQIPAELKPIVGRVHADDSCRQRTFATITWPRSSRTY